GSDLGPRTVRLIGIDTPEMSEGVRGLQARERLNALVEGRLVWAELGAEREDRYARLLAYLYVEDADGRWALGAVRATQVNLAMLEQGWADTLTIPPNVAYADLYAAARASDVEQGTGFWGGPQQGAPGVAAGDAAPPRLHCAV